jgi:hypothetical protein
VDQVPFQLLLNNGSFQLGDDPLVVSLCVLACEFIHPALDLVFGQLDGHDRPANTTAIIGEKAAYALSSRKHGNQLEV